MKYLLFLCILCAALPAKAEWPPKFTVHKFGSGAPVVLIVAGIQGDEPGGFSAAALLASQYSFSQGSVWVVPNLNFPSILERSRGVHGDMNRKFASLKSSDPEFHTIRRIQQLVSAPEVSLVLNMHDGSGFYRPKFETRNSNPDRWGQSVIIDMVGLPEHNDTALEDMAKNVVTRINRNLLQRQHVYHIKNTRTDIGNPEMEKCLTWFCVRQGKPAFAIEVSKDFSVEGRAYYHLQAVEAFLQLNGIALSRSFPLTLKGVRQALQHDISVTFAQDRIRLPLEDVRPRLSGYIPLPRDFYTGLQVSKPILAVGGDKSELRVHYGNRILTRFKPEWHDSLAHSLDFSVVVDGKERSVSSGEIINVRDNFLVRSRPGYRINAIGAELGDNECELRIRKKDFRAQYSVDVGKTIFRLEAYQGKAFAGMFLVRFGNEQTLARREYLPDSPGPESDQGM